MVDGGKQMSVDEQVSSVVLTASNSLEAVASSSNASFNHPDVSKVFFPLGCSELLLSMNFDSFSYFLTAL